MSPPAWRGPGRPAVDRFRSKYVIQPGGCWEWTGALQSGGYGSFGATPGKTVLAHRWSYERHVGPIPAGLTIDHLCRNKLCVRPEHLEAVSGAENTRRGGNAIKTHCNHGHELAGENLFMKRGKRQCRECARMQQRSAWRRKTAERQALVGGAL